LFSVPAAVNQYKLKTMRFLQSLLAPALASLALAAPTVSHDKRSLVERDGVVYNVFEHAATGARLEFVNNSGICETTKGVNQYSGYLSVGTNMNMWFWYAGILLHKSINNILTISGSLKLVKTPQQLPW
jgi:hypothetical protein